jgi:hypothetical protein
MAGLAASVTVQLHDQSVSKSGDGIHPISVAYQLTNTGLAKDGDGATLEPWLLSGAASSYEVRATVVSGTVGGSVTGSWISLSASPAWSISAGENEVVTATIFVEIRRVGTTTVLASATVFLTASNGFIG